MGEGGAGAFLAGALGVVGEGVGGGGQARGGLAHGVEQEGLVAEVGAGRGVEPPRGGARGRRARVVVIWNKGYCDKLVVQYIATKIQGRAWALCW